MKLTHVQYNHFFYLALNKIIICKTENNKMQLKRNILNYLNYWYIFPGHVKENIMEYLCVEEIIFEGFCN